MGWLDLIDLAIDVKQSANLYQAREQLARIETGALQEAMRKQVLEVLRNFVFSSAQEVRTLEQYLESSPQPVYVAGKVLEWRIQDVGISPEIFPEFTDKEYVQKVRGDLVRVIQDSRSKLEADEISQAEECVNAFVQMPLLDRAIETRSAREQLQATEAEWKQITGKRNLSTLAGLALLIGSIFICPSVWCFSTSWAFSVENESLHSILAIAALAANGILFLASVIGGIILLTRRSPRYRELQRDRKLWTEKLPGRETREQIVSAFGEQDSEGYQSMRAERERLIQDVMGQIDGYVLPDKLLPPALEEGKP
jgi:hypothetical protein